MPPPLAALLTLAFCAYLLRRETKLAGSSTGGLWLPIIWLFLICSRLPAHWLIALGVPAGAVGVSNEGTPFDAIVFSSLTLAGLAVLHKRGFGLGYFLRDNPWISLFLAYSLISVVWSDMPFVSFKRWIKILGHPVMALVILTHPRPLAALRHCLKKAAILLLPISLLLIKYYPHLGRSYDTWTGTAFHSGVTTAKNSLGAVCMMLGLFLFWDILQHRRELRGKRRRKELMVSGGLFLLAVYQLHLSNSATSDVCLVIAIAVTLVLQMRLVNPRHIGGILISGLVLLMVGDALFGVKDSVIRMLGRDPTLTERTGLWEAVLSVPNNVLLGSGFEIFWSGERLQTVERIMRWQPNQAHNGYIETYLNLGAIGLILLCGWLFAAFRKARHDLLRTPALGQLELAALLVVLAYNYTEAAFKTTHPIWTLLFLISISCASYHAQLHARRVAPRELHPVVARRELVATAGHYAAVT